MDFKEAVSRDCWNFLFQESNPLRPLRNRLKWFADKLFVFLGSKNPIQSQKFLKGSLKKKMLVLVCVVHL